VPRRTATTTSSRSSSGWAGNTVSFCYRGGFFCPVGCAELGRAELAIGVPCVYILAGGLGGLFSSVVWGGEAG
jgi:hypothetical protein